MFRAPRSPPLHPRSTSAPRRTSAACRSAGSLALAAAAALALGVGLVPAPAAAQTAAALDPSLQRVVAPVLRDWIVTSRDAARAQGVREIPAEIRAALTGYVPAAVLDRVRWRVDTSGYLSVQQSLFRLGATPAFTLDDVVIFAAEGAALEDPALWAHELYHVMQYRDWGVDGFVDRYLADYEAVEHDAAEYRWEWMKRTGRIPKPIDGNGQDD
jgi:Domain of unknown function (DUF4157)